MTLTVPKLDDRRFQDLVDEAKKRIPHYCKEWTDHNVSDPGVTLIELFAWMVDTLLYRLNQVPDLHYIKFMEMLGIKLREPAPARAPVTFWLSAPQNTPVVIPLGTEVSSTQTETERSIMFTTITDFTIIPPQLSLILCQRGEQKQFEEINLRSLEYGFDGIEIFSSPPKVNDALYFGFQNDLSNHILGFEVDFDAAYGAGVDPTQPPYVWEASTGNPLNQWEACELDIDTTHGMNSNGRIRIHLPKMGKHSISDNELFWVRVRIKEISPQERIAGMKPYVKSPRLQRCRCASWGGTISAEHARRINHEHLGRSDGSPGQRYYLQMTPVLKRQADEHLVVLVEGEPSQAWEEVTDFSNSGASDRHYTLDGTNGELRLGPAIRQQDGTVKLFGAIPPRGASLVFETYRYGGGQEGNLQAGILNTLKTAIPYIAEVKNRQPADGGLDVETLESAMQRAPELLRSRERAVAASDFEFLARQALPTAVGRVKCLEALPESADPARPGQVHVLVIPRQLHPEDPLSPRQLELKPEDAAIIKAYLDKRRLLTTRVTVSAPAYQWVAVKVRLCAAPGVDRSRVEIETLHRLYSYLNPLTGGPDADGWPFGRNLFISDVHQCLQGIPNVLFVQSVEMFMARPGGEAYGDPVDQIAVLRHSVIASAKHSVEFL